MPSTAGLPCTNFLPRSLLILILFAMQTSRIYHDSSVSGGLCHAVWTLLLTIVGSKLRSAPLRSWHLHLYLASAIATSIPHDSPCQPNNGPQRYVDARRAPSTILQLPAVSRVHFRRTALDDTSKPTTKQPDTALVQSPAYGTREHEIPSFASRECK